MARKINTLTSERPPAPKPKPKKNYYMILEGAGDLLRYDSVEVAIESLELDDYYEGDLITVVELVGTYTMKKRFIADE